MDIIGRSYMLITSRSWRVKGEGRAYDALSFSGVNGPYKDAVFWLTPDS